jgi:hypothetical protein
MNRSCSLRGGANDQFNNVDVSRLVDSEADRFCKRLD